jgi:hypothetical protein
MAIDTTQPESPGWWLNRLMQRLVEKRGHYDLLESYYDGTNAIPVHADKAVGQAYQRLMHLSRTNFAELVVEAVRERMLPVGFRTAAGDTLGDKEAWRIWQANSLDADSALVSTPQLSMGMAYVIVGPVDPDLGAPVITPEDPREVIVETDPVRRRKVLAGLKVFRDDVDETDRAYLYLPGIGRGMAEVWKAWRKAGPSDTGVVLDVGGWEWATGQPELLDHNQVPVVPFPNRPKIGAQVTRGEYETHLPILERINYTVLQRVEVATLQAFRQRAIKADDMADKDEDGNPIDYDDIFEQAPGSLWKIPATADIWESGVVDLGPLRQAIRDDVQDLAAVTRTPLYYLTADAQNGSAEGASLSREGLIFKTRDRIVETSEAWEKVMSLAFLTAGDTARAALPAMQVIWAPPERLSLSEKADAATKALAGGMTLRKVREDIWGLTPEEIAAMELEDTAAALRAQGAALVDQVVNGGTDPSSVAAAR